MKQLLLVLSLAIGAWMLSPTPQAEARGWGWSSGSHHERQGHHRRHHRSRVGVPELDPAAAGSAMVLLFGSAAYLFSRRREEDVA